MQKNNPKSGRGRKTPSPVVKSDSRRSPVRMSTRPATATNGSGGQRPRSANTARYTRAHDEFLSQSVRFVGEDSDRENDGMSISLQQSDLDSVEDLVNQQKKDIETDMLRKSPAHQRAAVPRSKRAPPVEVDAPCCDHHSDTTEVEKYMGEESTATQQALVRLASQLDRSEIDKTIQMLKYLKTLSIANERRSFSSHRNSTFQSRSKNPAVESGNVADVYFSRMLSDVADSDIEDNDEVNSHTAFFEDNVFRPKNPVHRRLDNASRTPTPNASNKRSPTPVGVDKHPSREYCPVLYRGEQRGTFDGDESPHIIKPAVVSRDTSNGFSNKNLTVVDDLSVCSKSSNSSFTAVGVK